MKNTRTILLTLTFSLATMLSGVAGPGRTGDPVGIAERELARRMATITEAERLISEGDRKLSEGDAEGALEAYRQAYQMLPDALAASESKKAARDKFSASAVKLAEQRISEGRFEDAEKLCEEVLAPDLNPGYRPAVKLKARLSDAEYYNRTITPVHVANVEQVKTWLREAQGFFDSGNYDLALKRYDQVLNIDPYNSAAQRGKEIVNSQIYNYAVDAYNNTRAQRLQEVQKAWETPTRPFLTDQRRPTIEMTGTEEQSRVALNNRKLDSIIIPRINFSDTSIREALEFLKQESARRDPNPAQAGQPKGVNIVLDVMAAGNIPDSGGADTGAGSASLASTPITVDLSEVPLRTALDYVTKLAGLKYRVDPFAILVVPINAQVDTLITKEYRVPANFLTTPMGDSGAGGAVNPLLTTGGTSGGTSVSARGTPTARAILESQGVTFPQGASATYFPSSSRLIVKNTQANLDLIDQIVESINSDRPMQVTIESKFVEITQNDLKELSFDWLLGGFNVDSSGRAFAGGGTRGPVRGSVEDYNSDFTFVDPITNTPIGENLSSAGLRSGTGAGNAIGLNAIDALINGTVAGLAPGTFSIAGVLTDPQFQVVIRALDQKKGIDLMTAPRVTTKSGQRALVEIIREFRYPTEFDPPQVPQGGNSGLSAAVVTPTTPTTFETRNVGVTLEVEPTVSSDNYTIELGLTPTVTEFEGFINYGSPIFGVAAASSTRQLLTENIINQPIFSTRRVNTSVTVWDGQTVVLGGMMREDVQKVDDKIPLLGDTPLIGRLFRSKVDQHIKRNLVIFVTANLIDPAGQNIRLNAQEERIMNEMNTIPEAGVIEGTSEPPLPQ